MHLAKVLNVLSQLLSYTMLADPSCNKLPYPYLQAQP